MVGDALEPAVLTSNCHLGPAGVTGMGMESQLGVISFRTSVEKLRIDQQYAGDGLLDGHGDAFRLRRPGSLPGNG